LGLLIILTGIWAYPKIDQFFKVDSCLDKGGSWNYETQECEFAEDLIESQEPDSSRGYDQLSDEQNRKTYTVSEYNTDLKNENIDRPEKTLITNPTVDTTRLFQIWTLDPNGPHADFWFKPTELYVVDYDGDGAMPYLLNKDSLQYFTTILSKWVGLFRLVRILYTFYGMRVKNRLNTHNGKIKKYYAQQNLYAMPFGTLRIAKTLGNILVHLSKQ
jgi:hypothetical protein